ncbi:hypothetical protein D9758_000358 [Tetrapyrgos nigripes]|uniref:RING-CH-type domain-containing protein n=1 Tax=Tetrapyrgos nigripes TaxID=182062 RepID=A0A8H5H1Z2_9AGAR|nr:hypothetical protein D9758_000358 [Tetrapyrgos nigripes]
MSDTEPDKQCRICLGGLEEELELGRLIRPCLCKGSMSFVHVGCLKRWRTTSPNPSAFFACPQCHYKYRLNRTLILGIATNPGKHRSCPFHGYEHTHCPTQVIVGGISAIIFTILTLLSSTITTYLLAVFQEPSYSSTFYVGYGYFVSPFDVLKDIVRAALRIMQDNEIFGEPDFLSTTSRRTASAAARPLSELPPQPAFKKFIQRFVIGLPLLGAGSLIHMFFSMPLLAPVQWIARYRGNRRRNNDSAANVTSLIIIILILVGAAKTLYTVYKWTESITRKLLLRAEDAILEVN